MSNGLTHSVTRFEFLKKYKLWSNTHTVLNDVHLHGHIYTVFEILCAATT